MSEKKFGYTEPRQWIRPLRELTPETSRGFEFIKFCEVILGIDLYPWQKWLAIHGLEILPDGSYRFKKIIVLVARQNGKTLFMACLYAWWLFIDSLRFPEKTKPVDFKIVGVAQNLDIAREPWQIVRRWALPYPPTPEEEDLTIPALQTECAKVVDTNGKESIIARTRAHYEIRAAVNSRGKPAARVGMDEIRELKTFAPWNAVSQTSKSFYNGQVWGISNAGESYSVVLKKQYDVGVGLIKSQATAMAEGVSPQEWAEENDSTFAFFDWSAPDGCEPLDEEAILQANPSIGYGEITVESCRNDYAGMLEADYRTEILCQWVETSIESYIAVKDWKANIVAPIDVKIPKDGRTVWAVDTSINRKTTYIAAAAYTTTGKPFVTVIEARVGLLWVVNFLKELAETSGHREVVIQARGNPAMEFIPPLKDAGLDVHEVEGSWFGVATGRIRDRARARNLVIVDQPAVNLAVSGAITKSFGENDAWNRKGSPVDISPLVAMTLALYGLEALEPKETKPESAYQSVGLMLLD